MAATPILRSAQPEPSVLPISANGRPDEMPSASISATRGPAERAQHVQNR